MYEPMLLWINTELEICRGQKHPEGAGVNGLFQSYFLCSLKVTDECTSIQVRGELGMNRNGSNLTIPIGMNGYYLYVQPITLLHFSKTWLCMAM